MLRSVAKSCLAYAYTHSGMPHLVGRVRPAGSSMPFIVGYHRVVESFDRSRKSAIPSLLISTSMLERHIDWFAKRFSLLSLDEIGLRLEANQPFHKPTAAITFDDGYADVYYNALPLLKRKGIPSTVFVVTGLIGTGRPQIFDRFYLQLRILQQRKLPLARTVAGALRSTGADAARIKRVECASDVPFEVMTTTLNSFAQEQVESALALLHEQNPIPAHELEQMTPLTWDMVETMHRQGTTIASHTVSHCLLASERGDTVREELINSKKMLEARLRAPVNHFAYPDGRFNPAVVKAVHAAGYRYAYTNCLWRDRNFPLLSIPRKVLWERACLNALGTFSSSIMSCHIHWLFDRKDRCEHDHSERL